LSSKRTLGTPGPGCSGDRKARRRVGKEEFEFIPKALGSLRKLHSRGVSRSGLVGCSSRFSGRRAQRHKSKTKSKRYYLSFLLSVSLASYFFIHFWQRWGWNSGPPSLSHTPSPLLLICLHIGSHTFAQVSIK
jgi:hypothetical protein